jgi:P27 family predicted phage terminase small subunit
MPGTRNSGGRNRKSNQQHVAEGTLQKCRHEEGGSTPEAPKGHPIPPNELKGEALAEWRRMVTRLELMKTLSVVDDAVLARYCQLHARADRLERQVAALPSAFYVDHLGNEKVHPAFSQLRSYDQAIRGYLVEFGMTPAARSRVRLPPAADPVDPFKEFDEPHEPTH